MKEAPAVYKGRIVEKKNFRTKIYGQNGSKKIVESWEEFEREMASGVWFATLDEAGDTPVKIEKKKPVKKAKEKQIVVDTKEEEPEVLAFEVTDDFLPKD